MKRLAILALLSAAPLFAQPGAVQGHAYLGGTQAAVSGIQSTNYLGGIIPSATISVYFTQTSILAPIFSASSGPGGVSGVIITAGGSYSVCPTAVTFTGGGGTGATGTPICLAGAVTGVAISAAGSGYSSLPTVGFTGGTGSGATGTATTAPILSSQFTANAVGTTDPGGWIFWAACGSKYDVTMSGGIAPNVYVNPVTLTGVSPSGCGTGSGGGGNTVVNITPGNGIGCTPLVSGSCTGAVTVTGLPLEHNGSAVTDQSLYNAWDSPASLSGGSIDPGYQAVKFKTDSIGGWGAETTATSGSLLMLVNPPAPGQQQLILYPTSSSGTGYSQNTVSCGGSANVLSCSGSGALANGGALAHPYCDLNCATNPTISWTFTAPSYLPSSGLTVYGGTVAYSTITTISGNQGTNTLTCGSGSQTNVYVYNVGTLPPIPQTYTTAIAGITTPSQVSTVTCTATISETDPVQAGSFANFPSVFLVINYSGTAPPATNAITVVPPLRFNPGANQLVLTVPFDVGIDTGTANTYAVSVPWINQQPGTTVKFIPAHGSTLTTPTFNLNGIGAATIVGPQGGALQSGDLNTTATAIVTLDNAGNWRLQDPQVSGSGGGTTTNALTMNNSGSGASSGTTFNGSAAETISYNTIGAAPTASPTFTGTVTMPAPTLNNVTGSTQCLHANSSGVVSGTGSDCGSGGGSVTWPSNNDIVVSNTTSSPAGLAPVNGDCVVGSGGIWTAGSCSGAGSGVQYNPSNTLYLFAGPDSTVGDDAGADTLGTAIPISTWNISGGVCTFNSTAAHNLVVGQWFTPDQVTGFPAVGSPYAAWTVGLDLFQVATVGSSTNWTASCPLLSNTSGSGGNAENANFFLPFYTTSLPFFNGHGTPDVALPVGSTIVSMQANYSTVYHPRLVNWQTSNPGAPMYFIITGGRNDIQACTSLSTLETDLMSVAASAHTDGAQVIFNTLTPNPWNTTNLGCHTAFQTMLALNNWAKTQLKNNFNSGPNCSTLCGQYFDRVADPYSVVNDLNNPQYYGSNPANANKIATYSKIENEAMSTQDSVMKGYPDFFTAGVNGGSIAPGFGIAFVPTVDTGFAFSLWNAAQTTNYFKLDTTGNGVQLPYIGSTACLATNSAGTIAGQNCMIALTTTGTSGAATFSGGTLNIPQYSSGFSNPMTTLGDTIYGGSAGAATRLAGPTTNAHTYFLGAQPTGSSVAPAWIDFATPPAIGATTPAAGSFSSLTDTGAAAGSGSNCLQINTSGAISNTGSACGTGSGGTSVQINGGTALSTLNITSNTTQACADSSGSGTAQSCNTSTSFTIFTNACIVYTTTTTNSGTGLTVNVNSAGAKSIAIPGSSGWTTTLTANIIPANKPLPMCYDGTNWDVTQTGTAANGGSSLSFVPPYMTDGTHKYLPFDGYQVTLPTSSPTWLNSIAPTSVTTGTNGNQVAVTTSAIVAFESQTATTSVEGVLRSESEQGAGAAQFPSAGIWIWDSTNNKIYILDTFVQSGSNNVTGLGLQCQSWTYSGSGNPAFSSNIQVLGASAIGVSDYAHLKLSVSGGTLSFQYSLDGGNIFRTITTQSVGTISKGGYFVGGTTAPFSVNVMSINVQ